MHQYPTYAIVDGLAVSTGTGLRITWQQGTFLANGLNGAMLELPVRALLHRIADLDQHLPCPQNKKIVIHLNAILGLLDDRTRDRNARGVLATEKV